MAAVSLSALAPCVEFSGLPPTWWAGEEMGGRKGQEEACSHGEDCSRGG